MLSSFYDTQVELASCTNTQFRSVSEALRAYQGNDHIYAIFPDKIRSAAQTFLTHFNGQTLYALKANPHPVVLDTVWQAGVRCFDVASLRELEYMHKNYPSARLYVMHPVKSRQLISRAYQLGVRDFVLDCHEELQKILDCTSEADDLNLYVRLSLPASDAILPLSGKFGADYDVAVSLLPRVRACSRHMGVSFHVGSQCMNPHTYDAAIAYTRRLIDAANITLDAIDVGGGFPVAYPGMDVPDIQTYFSAIHASLKHHGFAGVEWLAEPGRALCAEGGSTLARVELRKGEDLYLNDGVFGSLFDAGHFGWEYPVTLHRQRPPAPMKSKTGFRLFGPTCDSMDVIKGPVHLPSDTCEGDWIEFGHLGAYGYALATQFNGFYSETFVTIG